MTYTLQIQGLDSPKYFAPDVVPGIVSDAYKTQIQIILAEYNNFIQNPGDVNSTTGPQIFQTLLDARNQLLDYAANGIPIGVSGSGASVGFLNQRMARALDTLFKTFDIAGIANGTTGSTAQTNAVKNWLDLSIAGLGDYLAQAASAGESGRSIQAMIQLEYIKAGNDLITNKLGGLEEALQYTQTAVQILTELQVIHNKVTPNNAPTVSPSGTGDNYVEDYQHDGDIAYNNPIGVTATASPSDVSTFNELSSSTGRLHALISQLLAISNPPHTGSVESAFTISAGPDYVVTPVNPAYVGTLATSLYQVYVDMRNAPLVSSGSPATNNKCNGWIIDRMGNAKYQGNYSSRLTVAQTSAESLNDQQKQSVQQTLFLFQEFYQSGSGMLTQLNQIIQAMAQAIAG